ncbi:MAG: hypothetical protein JSW00_02960 [Thermoplasmata archaeon]|nr:MAG: hypothetical protein JSW00_02960 [Thermoplasmata archaeon]
MKRCSHQKRYVKTSGVFVFVSMMTLSAIFWFGIGGTVEGERSYVDDVLNLPFDEGWGITAFDNSRYGNHGTISGAAWEDGFLGYGLKFDGVDDYIDFGDIDSLDGITDLTICAWIKSDNNYGSNHFIISKNKTGQLTFDFLVDSATKTLRLACSDDGSSVYDYYGNTIFSDNDWHHVAITFEANKNVTFYIDGEMDKQNPTTLSSLFSGNARVLIGTNDVLVGSESTNGLIDEVYVFIRAFSAQDVLELYHSYDLVLELLFDENTGTQAYDSSGFDNHGTIYGASWTEGKIDKALYFDGVDDYVEVAHSDSLDITNEITYEAWVKIHEFRADNYQTLAWKEEIWSFQITPDKKVYFDLYIDGDWALGFPNADFGTLELTTNEWYHIALTYNRTEMRIYINGELDGSHSINGNINTSSNPVTIGRVLGRPESPNRKLNGTLDQVRIYNTSLSPEEILKHYAPPFLEIWTDKNTYYPGDLVTISAQYANGSAPDVTFDVQYPDMTRLTKKTESFDNSLANTILTLPSDSPSGTYTISAFTFDASAQTTFKVIIIPDIEQSPLNISSSDITSSKLNTANNEQITLYAMVHNTGNTSIPVNVIFYEGDPDIDGVLLGSDYITVPIEGSQPAKITYMAADGTHTIFVVVQTNGFPNASASRNLTFGQNVQSILVLSTGDTNIFKFEPGQEQIITVEVTCYLQTVTNVHLVVLDDQNVTINASIIPARTMMDGETVQFDLRIKAPGLPEGVKKLEKVIVIQAVGEGGIFSNAEKLDIVVTKSTTSSQDPTLIIVAVVLVIIAVLGAVAVAKRRNKHQIKLSRTQENILDYIKEHPKSSQEDTAEALKESQQAVNNDIDFLVREGFLSEEEDSGIKRYEILNENA